MVEVFTLLCYNYFDKSEFVEGIMAREINPKDTSRAMAFELWMPAPNPMVTFFKTIDVTNLIRISKKKHLKFNMLTRAKLRERKSSNKL